MEVVWRVGVLLTGEVLILVFLWNNGWIYNCGDTEELTGQGRREVFVAGE